jgi:hypothetical protein
MRNELTTPFWKNALNQLPAQIRERHVHDLEFAERWELRLDNLIETLTCAKAAIGRLFQTPRSAH